MLLPVLSKIIALSVSQYANSENQFEYEFGDVLDASVCKTNMESITKDVPITAPKDYLDEFSAGAMASRTASFLTQQMGITMSDGVDRIIFKNETFVEFFDSEYLFNKGYFGSIEEYKNLMDCARKKTRITTRDIYKGTRVLVVLESKQEEAKKAKEFAVSSFTEAVSKDAKKVKDAVLGNQKGGGSDYESEWDFDEFDYSDAYNLENYELVGGDDPRFELIGGDDRKPRSNFINRITESVKQKAKSLTNFATGKKSTMVGRVIDICKHTDGETYYKIEYKTKVDKKSVWENAKKQSFSETARDIASKVGSTVGGMTEFAEIEDAFNKFELGLAQNKLDEKLEEKKGGAEPEEEEDDGHETLLFPEIKRKGQSYENEMLDIEYDEEFKVYDTWIHEDYVYKEREFSTQMYYPKLNEEINVPFKNPEFFPLFHLFKYSFKKMMNLGRLNLCWYVLKSLQKSMSHYEEQINLISGLLPLDNLLAKNVKAANNPKVADMITEAGEKQSRKDTADNPDEPKDKTNPKTKGGRTSKNHRSANNQTRKLKGGAFNLSGTIKGDIAVIIDKMSKYLYCKNLRKIVDKEPSIASKAFSAISDKLSGKKSPTPIPPNEYAKFEIPKNHLMHYVEEEQRRFLGLSIMYFTDNDNREYNDDIFMEPYPFVDYTHISVSTPYDYYKEKNEDDVYNLNTTIDMFLETKYKGKTVYELVKILADFVWPERQHYVDPDEVPEEMDGGGRIMDRIKKGVSAVSSAASKAKHAVRKGLNKSIQSVGEAMAKNNMVLNKLFDYSFKRMVYYQLLNMHRSVYTFDGKLTHTQDMTDVQKQACSDKIIEMCFFYLKLKYVMIRTSDFACGTAINTALGIASTAGMVGINIGVSSALPPMLKNITELNTPQCYIAMLISGYGLLFMYPYPSTYLKRLVGLDISKEDNYSEETNNDFEDEPENYESIKNQKKN